MLSVSPKTLLRWEQVGLIKSRRAGWWAHRYFADADLRQLRARRKD
jgi:DNA-binding transcriptional MerR regulator